MIGALFRNVQYPRETVSPLAGALNLPACPDIQPDLFAAYRRQAGM